MEKNFVTLSDIDHLLLNITKFKKTNDLNLAVYKICDYLDYDEKSVEKLLKVDNILSEKRFIGACLIRIIAAQPSVFRDWEHKHKALAFLDNVFSEELPRPSKEMDFLRIDKFIELDKWFFDQCADLSNSITSEDTILKFRERFFQFISKKSIKSKIYIDAFVEKSFLTQQKISDLIAPFEQLNKLPDTSINKINLANDIAGKLIKYTIEIRESGLNKVADSLLLRPFQKMIDFALKQVPEEKRKKSTQLEIETIECKYPLHEICEFEFKFKIINKGKYEGQEVKIYLSTVSPQIEIAPNEINIGDTMPGNIDIVVNIKIKEPIEEDLLVLSAKITWFNFDGQFKERQKDISLQKQNIDIAWDVLSSKNPYNLEAIKTYNSLIGRAEIMQRLLSNINSDVLESAIIYGQKRVGKSSIGHALKSKLDEDNNFISVFLEVGDLDKTEPGVFVSHLGISIAEKVYSKLMPKIQKRITIPTFKQALAPLRDLFKSIIDEQENLKFVIIIDEFDEVPPELIDPINPIGDSFLHNIRSIAREDYVGFVLIGGENTRVIQERTDRFNKFNVLKVDYFDKENYWADFEELIARPLRNTGIEYSTDALQTLYNYTEGNPFFTNLLCKDLYKFICDNKISYIDKQHIVKIAEWKIIDETKKIEINQVSHFWIDGIFFESRGKREIIETSRRRFLMAIAELKRKSKKITEKEMQNTNLLRQMRVDTFFDSFKSRGILVPVATGHHIVEYRLKPFLIEKWLVETGWKEMTNTFHDEDAVAVFQQQDNESYVKDSEIQILVDKWKMYRGREVSINNIRAWLDQFEDNIERRYMFNVLEKIKFYGEFEVRISLKNIYNRILHDFNVDIKNFRKNIILSTFYQDKISKSNIQYVRLFKSENDFEERNILPLTRVIERIKDKSTNISSIIFVDDIIGTGMSTGEELKNFLEVTQEYLIERNIRVYVSSICATTTGIENLNEIKSKFNCDVRIIYQHEIPEDQTIHSNSLFGPIEKSNISRIIVKYSTKIVQKIKSSNFTELGFGNCGLLVVFQDACPNNTLPLIWYEEHGVWKALFSRK